MKKKISTLSRFFLTAAPPILAALFSAVPAQAADAPQGSRQPENRFLFVVDTASAMRTYSNSVVQGVVELLNSDMRGEFRQGDTIGLWTYNDKLHPEFPMQVWSKADKNTLAADMVAWLQERRYEKQAHLERVMPVLNQVIRNSERITIILIFDGTGLIQGTPFDKDIHLLQSKYARELRSAHVPFVMVLAAHNGAVFDYTINYPGLVAIPDTAYPEKIVQTNAPAAVVAMPLTNTLAKPRRMNSIIMSHATNAVHVATPAPAIVTPPPKPAPPLVVAPVLAQPPAIAVAPTPVSPPILAPTVPPPAAPVAPAKPVIAVTAPPPQEVAPAKTQPTPPPIVARQNPSPANEIAPPQAPPASVTTNAPQPPAFAPVARMPVANIGPTGGAQLALFVMAFSLLTIAVVLVVFLVRRSRNASQSSLITQSIDRPR